MTINNGQTASVPSDQSAAGDSEEALFADVFANSSLLSGEVASLPNDGEDESLEDESDDDLDDDSNSTVDEDDDEEDGAVPKPDEDDDEDDTSTEEDSDDDDTDEGEVDWEFQIPVKIDGEESKVTLEELRKGYQTQQHLSKQGRELGEQKTAFEKEKSEGLEKVISTAELLNAQVMKQETELATKYNELKETIAQKKKEGDKYSANELKDDLEELQSQYWVARKDREALEKNVSSARAAQEEERMKADVERFGKEIESLIPDFDNDRATAIRDFAVQEGVPEELINVLASAGAVKFIDDYRILKESLNKGAARKKSIPTRKIAPTKKSTTTKSKTAARESAISTKLARGEATEDEGYDFLKGMAKKYGM